MSLWPFKLGSDENFRQSRRTIYDELGDAPPQFDFRTEMHRYNEARWRRGWIHNVLPTVFYGSTLGFLWGMNESRRGLVRHMSRPRIIVTNTLAGSLISLATSLSHHMLLVMWDYKASLWQPLAAGASGGVAWSFVAPGVSVSRGSLGGMILGMFYTIVYVAVTKYQEHALVNFFATQQQIETPVTRVAPEMQQMYRAWLFDHRPIEDTDMARRKALLIERETSDVRLDSTSFMEAMKLKELDKFEFPEWWPLKFQAKDDKEALLQQRQKDDAFERRRKALIDNQQGMFSHPLRTAAGKEVSDAVLEK